jgi:FMN phosphatase YigB (HAD superfamily)
MAQADPRKTLFIDDRRQNLTPAAALGMTTIQFESPERLRTSLQAHGLLK